MIIARSSCSRASACGGNEARETWWFGLVSPSEAGWLPADDEGVSPNESELDSAPLHFWRSAKLPDLLKPAIGEEATGICTRWDARGGWRERMPKERTWYPGDPLHRTWQVVGCGQRRRGSHNSDDLWQRKSERPILALMLGKLSGAEGLCRRRVFKAEGGAD